MPELEQRPQETSPDQNPFGASRTSRRKAPGKIGEDLNKAIEDLKPEEIFSSRTNKQEQYPSRAIGKGYESLVFEFDDAKHENVVFKVNFDRTKPILKAHQEGTIATIQAIEQMETDMNEYKEKMRELKKYFGASAVPAERLMIKDMPVSRTVVDKLAPGVFSETASIPPTLPAWVAVQRRIDLPPANTTGLRGYYAEVSSNRPNQPISERAPGVTYAMGHDILVGNDVQRLSKDMQRDMVLEMYADLKPVAARLEEDPEFKAKLQDTVKRLIAYTTETKNVLDFAGKDNLVMTKGDTGWDFKILDPFVPGYVTLDALKDVADDVRAGREIPNEVGPAMNAMNTVRTINALALLADVPDRVEAEALKGIPGSVWYEAFRRTLPQPPESKTQSKQQEEGTVKTMKTVKTRKT